MRSSIDRCKLSSWEWILKCIKTLDATGGIKPFPNYPFALRLVQALTENRILIIAKSRQMMATWTVSAFTLHRCFYSQPGLYLFLSKGARESGELLRRLKQISKNLPPIFSQEIKAKRDEIEFLNGSRIISLPATEFASRMYSPTGVFWDEMAFTPHDEEIWTSLKPAIDSGGTFTGVSTPNGKQNVFYQLFKDDANTFGKLTLHYSEHPLRDDDWKIEAGRGISKTRWRQEYEIDFGAMADRVFDEFDPEIHIRKGRFFAALAGGRIYRGIDFGFHSPYVVWVHLSESGELTVFDEMEGEDLTLDRLISAIREVDRRNMLKEKDFIFTACDPAGAAKNDSGLTSTDRLKQSGIKLVWRASLINDGVDELKTMLLDHNGNVCLKFTANVPKTILHFQQYRWDKKKEKPVKGEGHDHAVDALRYLIVNLFGQKGKDWSGAKVMGVGR